jgi:hypothetical protein
MVNSYRLDSAIAAKAMLILALFVQSTAQAQGPASPKITPKEASGNIVKQPRVLKLVFPTLSSDVVTGNADGNNPEISAVAMPPGGKCGGGGIRATTARLISSVGLGLTAKANEFVPWAYVMQNLNPDYSPSGSAIDLASNVSQGLSGGAKYFPGTDSVFARLSNGDLLAARMSYIERSTTPYWNGKSGGRVGVLTMRSKNCGETWEFNGILDPAKITLKFNGKDYPGLGAYPRRDIEGTLIQGGVDRQEFYADPFDDQTAYMTLWFGGNTNVPDPPIFGTPPPVANSMIFTSTDGGKTWGSQPTKMFDTRPTPLAMTTTRAKRLFVFGCDGWTPTLYYMREGRYVGSWPVFHGEAANPENACAGDIGSKATPKLTNPGYLSRVKQDVSISRVDGQGDHDTVRVVYPATRGGRRIAHIVVVRIHEAGTTLVLSKLHEDTISAASKTGNIIYPTFIETDRVDLPKTSTTNTAILYWYETASVPGPLGQPASVQLFTRYSIFHDAGSIPGGTASMPQDLSTTNGARRYWSPNSGDFVGDYMRGAFVYDGKLRFIAQWPERSGKTVRIRYNVVTVDP